MGRGGDPSLRSGGHPRAGLRRGCEFDAARASERDVDILEAECFKLSFDGHGITPRDAVGALHASLRRPRAHESTTTSESPRFGLGVHRRVDCDERARPRAADDPRFDVSVPANAVRRRSSFSIQNRDGAPWIRTRRVLVFCVSIAGSGFPFTHPAVRLSGAHCQSNDGKDEPPPSVSFDPCGLSTSVSTSRADATDALTAPVPPWGF